MEELERNSNLRFRSWSKNYDNPFNYWHFFLLNRSIVHLLNPPINSSVLDVGCGTGILLKQLLSTKRGLALYGVDLSPQMLEKAKSKLKGYKNIKLQLGSANALPYIDNYFDFVVCSCSFHHHPNSERSLSEMKRVAKPGGKILVLDLSTDGIIRKIIFKIENTVGKEGKVFRYSSNQMKNLFANTGLINIQQRTALYANLITMGSKKERH